MRVLLFSNAPWGKGGYANQTRYLMQHLNNLGHTVAVACNYGLAGGPLGSEGGFQLYPVGYDKNSNDVVQAHADDFKADVILSVYDVWPLSFKNLKTPWVAWLPVDHQPVPPGVLKALKPARLAASFSRFGQIELQKAGVESATYIPLGVDTQVFSPGDGSTDAHRAEARKRLGLPEHKFIFGQVGMNISYPGRKCIPQVLQAFAQFRKLFSDALLYLHTEELGVHAGIRLKPLLDALELGPDAVMVCDQYQYLMGFPDQYMADIYRAMDVLLSPSMAEGFGIPIMEAQACGTPVIATDFSSMPELVAGGWIITDFERWWSPQEAWQVLPHVDAIKLEMIHAYLASPQDMAQRGRQARAKALEYDFERVVAPQWDALLKSL